MHHYWLYIAILVVCWIVLLASVAHRRRVLRPIYHKHLHETNRERLFISSVAFFVTFASVRALTHAIHAGRGPFHDVTMGGRHIHHLVWGILILLVVGYLWLVHAGIRNQTVALWLARSLSLFYGIGAALTLDEFALWLNLRDVYWEREGRQSIDAAFLFGGLLSIGVWGGPFLHALAKEVFRRRRT